MHKILALTAVVFLWLTSTALAQNCAVNEVACQRPDVSNAPEPYCASKAALLAGTFNDTCYAVLSFAPVPPGVDAGDHAEATCASEIGGHAASIHSAAEDAFISDLRPSGESGTVYIGGQCLGATCTAGTSPPTDWTWTDGTPWDFENWRTGTGEPSGDGRCVQFWPDSNGSLSGWNDVPCTAAINFNVVCKYVPTP